MARRQTSPPIAKVVVGIKVKLTVLQEGGGDQHNARGGRKGGEQEVGEVEVAEVVDSRVRVKAILGATSLFHWHPHPGVSICSENLIFSCPTFWPD